MINNGLWQTFESLGVSYEQFVKSSQLPVNIINEKSISLETYVTIWHNYSSLVSNIESSIIKMATGFDVTQYPPTIMAAYYAPNYMECLKTICKYTKLCPPLKIVIEEEDNIGITVSSCFNNIALPDLMAGSTLAFLIEIGRLGTGEVITPLALYTTIKDSNSQELSHYFNCPVLYGSEMNKLLLKKEDGYRVFNSYNAELIELVVPQLDKQIGNSTSPNTLEIVQWHIKRNLTRNEAGIEQISKELMLSSRTLQRQLKTLGTTYNLEVKKVRMELAKQYLKEERLSNKEIAFLLGYSDENSFYRAFKKWEKTTISEWKKRKRVG